MNKYKTIAMISSIFSILFILVTAVSFHEKTMAEVDMLKGAQQGEKSRINVIEDNATRNLTEINSLKSDVNVNAKSIIDNSNKVAVVKNDMQNYVLKSDFRGSMDIIHQDHQDVNKQLFKTQTDSIEFQQHVGAEFSNVYRAILGIR